MNIILSTGNVSKAEQIAAVFVGLPVNILTLNQAGISGSAIEDGSTLAENALKKARFARGQSQNWCMADDTGIFIDALGGKPGIHAARWAGDTSTTEEIMQFTLDQLLGVQLDKRTATFKTVAALIEPDGAEHLFVGELSGKILLQPAVPCQPQMPYSAIFQPDGYTKTWAEMSVTEENAISHRGQAFRKVREFLQRHTNN